MQAADESVGREEEGSCAQLLSVTQNRALELSAPGRVRWVGLLPRVVGSLRKAAGKTRKPSCLLRHRGTLPVRCTRAEEEPPGGCDFWLLLTRTENPMFCSRRLRAT